MLLGLPNIQVVATHLPPEEVEGVRQMFIDMDKDNSGTISFEELREGMYSFFTRVCVVCLLP